jgi:hypothetical protein
VSAEPCLAALAVGLALQRKIAAFDRVGALAVHSGCLHALGCALARDEAGNLLAHQMRDLCWGCDPVVGEAVGHGDRAVLFIGD